MGFRVVGVLGFGFWILGVGAECRVWGLEFRGLGLGVGFWGMGFGVYHHPVRHHVHDLRRKKVVSISSVLCYFGVGAVLS